MSLDARHRPLGQRLCKLADEFESMAIVELLKGLQQEAAAGRAAAQAVSSQPETGLSPDHA
jgi:hypothetical protein